MNDVYAIIALVWIHFFADFVMQSDVVAKGKSASNKLLLYHVSLYTLPFYIFGVEFAIVNGMLHFITDWYTSRVTSCYWQQDKRHMFFVVIGFDQAVHMTCLILTYFWMVK